MAAAAVARLSMDAPVPDRGTFSAARVGVLVGATSELWVAEEALGRWFPRVQRITLPADDVAEAEQIARQIGTDIIVATSAPVAAARLAMAVGATLLWVPPEDVVGLTSHTTLSHSTTPLPTVRLARDLSEPVLVHAVCRPNGTEFLRLRGGDGGSSRAREAVVRSSDPLRIAASPSILPAGIVYGHTDVRADGSGQVTVTIDDLPARSASSVHLEPDAAELRLLTLSGRRH